VKSNVNLWPKIERGNHENKEDVKKLSSWHIKVDVKSLPFIGIKAVCLRPSQ